MSLAVRDEAPPEISRPLPRDGMWIILRSLQQVLGEDGLRRVVVCAGLAPDILSGISQQGRGWPALTHDMAGHVTRAVFDLYGNRAREHLLAAGRWQFAYAREHLPGRVSALAGMIKALPLDVRVKIVLEQGARDLERNSNALPEVAPTAGGFIVIDPASPTCAGQSAAYPMCVSRVGLLSAALEWATGGSLYAVTETMCHAMGGRDCRFMIVRCL